MNHSLKPGDKMTVRAEPGMSTDLRLVFDDGTEISTTLAPGIVMNIIAGTRNSMNLYIEGAQSGSIGIVK